MQLKNFYWKAEKIEIEQKKELIFNGLEFSSRWIWEKIDKEKNQRQKKKQKKQKHKIESKNNFQFKHLR